MSEKITKPISAGKVKKNSDELAREYRFDYSKAKPNRFAERAREGYRTVVLDPDIAAVFQDSESVNAVLRALITTMPKKRRAAKSR